MYISVPYSSAFTPIAGSKFSDIDINIILTILTYYYNNKFRKIDIHNNITKLIENVTLYFNISSVNEINTMFKDQFEFYEININDIINYNDNILDTIYYNVNKKNNFKYNIFNYNIIKNYLQTFVIPNIKYSEDCYNCSFMDIIGETFSRYKTGFSGTVSMILPKTVDTIYNITNILSNKLDDASTAAAILGVINNKINESLHYIDIYNDILTNICTVLKNGKYNVFIDSGAFFINNNTLNVIDYFSKNLDYNIYIYIDSNDIKMVYIKDKNIHILYENIVYNTQELLFIMIINILLVNI